jgi:hypothetical protein
MKKERIRKPDGRYLIYYSFEPVELLPTKEKRLQKKRGDKLRATGKTH